MGSEHEDKWRRRAKKYYSITLNYYEEVSLKYIAHNSMCFLIFQALIELFQKHFMVCFDAEKKSTPEEIREWFNTQLVGYGLEPWGIRSRKWIIAKSKIRLSTTMWKQRDTPLS